MIAITCAFLSGITVILSRSINGYLAKEIDPYQSTFFNYFIGFIVSFILLIIKQFHNLSLINHFHHPLFLIGGSIGVFNIFISNIVTKKISPIQLTVITFISRLCSAMILDIILYHIFSLKTFICCIIIILGLIIYQSQD